MRKNYFNQSHVRQLTFVLTGMAIFMSPPRSEAQPFSPYSDFQSLTLSQLETLQVKLTFGGIQEEPVPTVAFTSPSNTLDLSKFVPFRRSGFSYKNDNHGIRNFTASSVELQAVVQQAGLVAGVAAGGVESPKYLSFALFAGAVSKGFEAILNPTDAAALLNALRIALAGNATGLAVINDFGCVTALREPGTPADVSGSVGVTFGGFRVNRSTGRFVGIATLKNNSSSSVAGPISLVLSLPNSVQLFNAVGTTCGTTPVGLAFLNVPLVGNALPAGGTAQVGLDISNSESRTISPVPKVLAGPGAR
jgi:hypothetical protein